MYICGAISLENKCMLFSYKCHIDIYSVGNAGNENLWINEDPADKGHSSNIVFLSDDLWYITFH